MEKSDISETEENKLYEYRERIVFDETGRSNVKSEI